MFEWKGLKDGKHIQSGASAIQLMPAAEKKKELNLKYPLKNNWNISSFAKGDAQDASRAVSSDVHSRCMFY